MEQIIIEIRAAEGGEDAKLLVVEMCNIYQKASNINLFTYTIEQ
jgi:protein subunit release factor A